MPENPIYDPTKIVKRAYVKDVNSSNLSEPSADGEVPKYDASKIVKRGYVAKEDFQEEGRQGQPQVHPRLHSGCTGFPVAA